MTLYRHYSGYFGNNPNNKGIQFIGWASNHRYAENNQLLWWESWVIIVLFRTTSEAIKSASCSSKDSTKSVCWSLIFFHWVLSLLPLFIFKRHVADIILTTVFDTWVVCTSLGAGFTSYEGQDSLSGVYGRKILGNQLGLKVPPSSTLCQCRSVHCWDGGPVSLWQQRWR